MTQAYPATVVQSPPECPHAVRRILKDPTLVSGIVGSTGPLADTRGSSPCVSWGSRARRVPCVRVRIEVVPYEASLTAPVTSRGCVIGDVFVRCGALHTAAQLGCLHVCQDAVQRVAGWLRLPSELLSNECSKFLVRGPGYLKNSLRFFLSCSYRN